MAATGTSTLSNLSSYVDRTGLERAKPLILYGEYGKKITIPQKNSKVYKARRYERIAPTGGTQSSNLRAMVEGTVPTNTTPTITDVSATVAQYGQYFIFTDQAQWVNEVSVDTELMSVNSQNMAETLDGVVRDNIQAGTNVFHLTDAIGGVSGAARSNVAGVINAAALDKAIRNLQGSNAVMVAPNLTASNKVGTSGIRAGYVAIIHPDVLYDLEQVSGYKSIADYGQPATLKGEVGAYKNIRFVMSTEAKIFPDSGAAKAGTKSTTGTNSDVYSTIIVGENAYAAIDLASTAKTHYVPIGQPDHADPLGQTATLGWTAMATALILNDNWILRFESVASA